MELQEFVASIHAELKNNFPVPQCIVVGDEPSGDFGIAHFYGLDANGCGIMSYDVGYLPSRHTVVHEFGHAIHSLIERTRPNIIDEFFAALGFGVTPDDAIFDSQTQTSAFQAWRRIPGEMFAEAFAYGVCLDYYQCALYALNNWTAEEVQMAFLNFFGTLREGANELTNAEMQELKAAMAQAANAAAIDVIREVTTKLDSGFNTSVTTFLDRLAAGDKHVATAPVD